MQRKRPLSPHLQIYKPQLTSVLSVTHRATGLILTFGSMFFVAWLLAVAAGPEKYGAYMDLVNSWFGRAFLAGLTFCFFYHMTNGIRHLFWDVGRGFSLPQAYISGWIVVIASIMLTILVWVIL